MRKREHLCYDQAADPGSRGWAQPSCFSRSRNTASVRPLSTLGQNIKMVWAVTWLRQVQYSVAAIGKNSARKNQQALANGFKQHVQIVQSLPVLLNKHFSHL